MNYPMNNEQFTDWDSCPKNCLFLWLGQHKDSLESCVPPHTDTEREREEKEAERRNFLLFMEILRSVDHLNRFPGDPQGE